MAPNINGNKRATKVTLNAMLLKRVLERAPHGSVEPHFNDRTAFASQGMLREVDSAAISSTGASSHCATAGRSSGKIRTSIGESRVNNA
jgi:hypothetical protein